MGRALDMTIRRAPCAVLLLSFGVPSAILTAQPKLEITSPKDGEVAYSGRSLTARVAASPQGVFHSVGFHATHPLESSQVLTRPPYEFTVQIPPDIASREYSLRTTGLTGPRPGTDSQSVSMKVERPDAPVSVSSEPSMLRLRVGDPGFLRVVATYGDGSTADVSQSRRTTYSSDSPDVVTVSRDGRVSAVGIGSANIVINGSLLVPVTVTKPAVVGGIPKPGGPN